MRGIRYRRRGAQIPFDGSGLRDIQRHDSNSGVRCEERNELVLPSLSIQPVQDFEIAGPVLMSREEKLGSDLPIAAERAGGPSSMDRSGAHRLWEMSAGIAVQSPGFM